MGSGLEGMVVWGTDGMGIDIGWLGHEVSDMDGNVVGAGWGGSWGCVENMGV